MPFLVRDGRDLKGECAICGELAAGYWCARCEEIELSQPEVVSALTNEKPTEPSTSQKGR